MTRFADRLGIGSVKETAEGYLVATARVARTGIQKYLASELGDVAIAAGFKPGDVVRVHRSPEEVFSDKTLASITRVPVTIDHPGENVTPANWARLAKGEVGDAYAREAEWIVVNPMIKDADAIKAARTTHPEISMGYEAKIIVAKDQAIADFDMTDIRMNHLALVGAGRAGPQARIGDSWGASPVQDFQPGELPNNPKGVHMDLKTVVLGDKAVQVAVADLAAIEQYKAQMTKALADAEAAKSKVEKDKDEEIGELKGKLKKAEDAAVVDLDALVADRTALVAQVHAIDASIPVIGKSADELRKTAVARKWGDSMVADANPDVIMGLFKAACKDSVPANPVRGIVADGLHDLNDADRLVQVAHNGYAARLQRNKGA